ncbi:hypothetical protein BH11PLA2_BH11PLA2_00870 [soil metagenome]
MKRSPILLLAGPTLLVLLVVLGLIWSRSSQPIPMRDFVEYWSAGHAFLNGKNPYDPNVLLALQREATNTLTLDQAMMMWNPPWALGFVAPLGMLPAKTAHIAWLIVHFAVVLASIAMLLTVYGMPKDYWLIGFAVGMIFAPLLLLIWYGQIGGFCLLGLAGFLYFDHRQRPVTAGAFAALTALKPHLLFGFGLMLLLDALVNRRGRRVLLGGGAAFLFASLLAWAINPMVYNYYLDSIRSPSSAAHVSVQEWHQPLLSFQLRVAIDPLVGGRLSPKYFWIQFVPTAVTAVGLLLFWLKRRKPANWPVQTPRLILVSVIAAAYGAWMFDLVVLIVPLMQATVWLVKSSPTHRTEVIALAVAFVVFSIGSSMGPTIAIEASGIVMNLHEFIFFSPVLLLFYLLAGRIATRSSS